MQTVPGTLMSAEPYTLTAEQIDALNSMPPGVYFVCSMCRRFQPAPTTITFSGDQMVCPACAKQAGL